MQDKDYMHLAIQQAFYAQKAGEIPIGALIIIDNNIIAKAHNLCKTLNDPTAHAEMLAITSACNYLASPYLNQATLYVTLEPCLMCISALKYAQIKQVIYAVNDDKNGYSTIQSKFIEAKIIDNQQIQDKAKYILQSFFKTLRS